MMKSIEIGALSLVMAVWCGISRKRSRRSTHDVRSVTGLMSTSPGPLMPMARPSRNSTIRWYSRTILTDSPAVTSRTTSPNTPTMMPTIMRPAPRCPGRGWDLIPHHRFRLFTPHVEADPVGPEDLDPATGPDRPVHRHRRPLLTTDTHDASGDQVAHCETLGAFQGCRDGDQASSAGPSGPSTR